MSAPVMLVAAGSRSIGAAIARQAGEQGYDVAINYMSNREAAEEVANHVRVQGRKAVAIQADMAKEDDIRRMFVELDQHFDRLDALVYNAGGYAGNTSSLADASTETLRKAIELNLLGAHFCAAEAIRRMSTNTGGKGGNIVFITSRSSEFGNPHVGVWYAASKNGLAVLTTALCKEVAGDGVRVNAVSPGPIHTDANDPALRPERLQWIPMRRFGKPVEVANTVLFLTSPAASFISGAIVNVSGGR
jgi:NAD(P)-dependent dehydrogenase (short-subunit alcohol dehydrogenase family)